MTATEIFDTWTDDDKRSFQDSIAYRPRNPDNFTEKENRVHNELIRLTYAEKRP